MDSVNWSTITPDESWELVCPAGKAHVIVSGPVYLWHVDGGAIGEAASAEAAMDAAEAALGVARCRSLTGEPLPGRSAPENGQVFPGAPTPPPQRVDSSFHVRPLIARITERQPADVRAQLLERVERVERYTAAIRALAEEGGDDVLLRTMLGEADADARAAVESALGVLREQQTALAFAETRLALAREEVERSRKEVATIEASIDRVKESVIRPLCETSGTGETRAIKTETGRVSLRRTPGRVELDDDPDVLDFIAAADATLIRIKREPDRAAIAAALKDGREIPGARLVVETRVEVRG